MDRLATHIVAKRSEPVADPKGEETRQDLARELRNLGERLLFWGTVGLAGEVDRLNKIADRIEGGRETPDAASTKPDPDLFATFYAHDQADGRELKIVVRRESGNAYQTEHFRVHAVGRNLPSGVQERVSNLLPPALHAAADEIERALSSGTV